MEPIRADMDITLVNHMKHKPIANTCKVVGCSKDWNGTFPLCDGHYKLIMMGFDFNIEKVEM